MRALQIIVGFLVLIAGVSLCVQAEPLLLRIIGLSVTSVGAWNLSSGIRRQVENSSNKR